MNKQIDEKYMALALSLAAKGQGHTSPNPMVGAVIVKNDVILGEGYHHKAGEAHAEVNAFSDAKAKGQNVEGGTLYVTLEPCSHYGKTPPCANRIIEEKISRVVIGTKDPNPLVAGKGIAILLEAGIKVEVGILEKECTHLNEQFLTSFMIGRPFITVKSAMSLDGKIATKSGESKWITDEAARLDGHILRATHDVILTGIGTILADNPTLNVRLPKENGYLDNPKNPTVVILDSYGRTPLNAKLWDIPNRKIIIFVRKDCAEDRLPALRKKAEIVTLDKIELEQVLFELHKRQYLSVLVEGGSKIIASFIEAKLVDKIVTYIGNKVIGGAEAVSAVGGEGVEKLAEALPLEFKDTKLIGNNIRIEAYHRERKGAYVHRDN